MPDMGDAVNWQNLQSLPLVAVAGYDDGPKSKWPPEAWVYFAAKGIPALHISVLANPTSMAFDVEPGNAPADKVSVAIATRTSKGLPSVAYGDETTIDQLAVTWRAGALWPMPGAYLWAASGEPGKIPGWCPVRPVAVQDRYPGPYDLSTLYNGWLPILGPPPIPPLTEEELMGASIAVAPDGTVHIAAVGKGNTRTTHLLHVIPGLPPNPVSIIDITVQVQGIPGSGKPFLVAP